MSLSDYERATLRLTAFKMLDGWGVTDEKGNFRRWSVSERRERAAEYVSWALSTEVASCTFCGKEASEVERLIAGPASNAICNECVALCADILKERDAALRAEVLRIIEEVKAAKKAAQAGEALGRDPQGLDAKHEHAVAEGDAP